MSKRDTPGPETQQGRKNSALLLGHPIRAFWRHSSIVPYCPEKNRLLHPHSFERATFFRHLIHEATGLCVHFRPALVAWREDLRALAHFPLSPMPLFCIPSHVRIVPKVRTYP